jgi:hypothetical protein
MEATAILGIIIIFILSIKGTYEAKKMGISIKNFFYFCEKITNFIFYSILVEKTKNGYKRNWLCHQQNK